MMKCVMNGCPTTREIFSIKIPVPEEVKRRADELQRNKMKAKLALPAPGDAAPSSVGSTPTSAGPSTPPPITKAPALRKPIRPVKK
jgi:hypothetical protein